jgi:hypothetical protein
MLLPVLRAPVATGRGLLLDFAVFFPLPACCDDFPFAISSSDRNLDAAPAK